MNTEERKMSILRLFRRVVRRVINKIRNAELFVFNMTMRRRRGTIHSICDRNVHSTFNSVRRATMHSIREVLSMSDELRRALYSSGASIDMEFSPPDLIGTSEIFTMEHREKICTVLPARAQGYMWSLTFSTSQHGFSLASMYRKMQRVDSPVLLVIQDTDNNVFGALTSCALHPSEHFYGTGESLLFSFQRVDEPRRPSAVTDDADKPKEEAKEENLKDEKGDQAPPVKTKFKYWGWTGDNMYFIRGSNDNISIGAGDGKFGLWLDGDLYLGRTQRCTTYGNEPLTTREDFIVKIMECWTFI